MKFGTGMILAAAAVLCTGCQAERTGENNTAAETEMKTEVEETQRKEKEASVSIIGGEDGPTSIFVAGKVTDMEEISDYPSFGKQAEELLIDPDGTGRVYLDTVQSDGVLIEEEGNWTPRTDDRGVAVIHGLWGTALLRRQEENHLWSVEAAADMKTLNQSYMKEEHSTEIFPSNGVVFIYQLENGNITEEYQLMMETGQLFGRKAAAEDAGEEIAMFELLREIKKREDRRRPDETTEPEVLLEKLKQENITKIWDQTVAADGVEVFLCSCADRLADLRLVWKDPETGELQAERIVWE